MKRRIAHLAVALVCACWVLALGPAYARADGAGPMPVYQSLDELEGKRFAYITGSVYNQFIRERVPNTSESFYASLADCIAALEAGKADAAVQLSSGCQLAVNRKRGTVAMLPEHVVDVEEGYFFAHGSPLAEKFDDVIDDFWADGTIERLQAKWESADEAAKVLPEQDWEAPHGTLRFATTGALEPVSYVGADGIPTGFDVELALLIAERLGYHLEVSASTMDACLASVQAGKADFGGCVTITEERAEFVDFSKPTMDAYIAAIVAADTTSGASPSALEISSLADLAGKKLCAVTGSAYPPMVVDQIDGVKLKNFSYYESPSDAGAALLSGKVDAYIDGGAVAELLCANNPRLGIIGEVIAPDDIGLCLKKSSPLTEQFNKLIRQYRQDGTLEALHDKWMGSDESAKTVPKQDWDAPNGTLKVIGSTLEPMCYVSGDRKVKGYEVELLLDIARDLGYRVSISTAPFSGVLASVESGKADVAIGNISITDERAERVDFTEPTYEGGVLAVVRKDATAADGAKPTLIDRLCASFYKTFVQESRWMLILGGLCVTIIIAVCSGALGTLLGYLTVLAREIGTRWVVKVVDVYQAIMGGVPIVVILMALYYVIFGSIDIAGEIVAVLAFALSFGSTAGTTMWTAVKGIDDGQRESGLALGYTPRQVFHKIIFPQATVQFMPQLIGQAVSLLKETAVVGYIAVTDLTRASDLIRARTMDAFFPIVVTAIIYCVCCRVLAAVLSALAARMNPENRPFAAEEGK